MAGETIKVFGTTKTLEASGGTITNNSVVQANDATYGIVADGASFPDAKFVLGFAYTTAPTESTLLVLLARPINIDSTSDSDAPEAAFMPHRIGEFTVNNIGASTMQYAVLDAFDVPTEAEYYIKNDNTGQTVNAGWTLKVTPFSYKAAT